VHLSRALAAASTALLFAAPAARGRRSLGPFERGICPPLTTHGLVRGGFSSACSSRAGVRVCDAIAYLKTDWGFAHPSVRGVVASVIGVILCLTANAALAEEPLKLANSQLEPVKWTELAGWSADDHLAAFAAYQTSCQALRKMRRAGERGRISGALWTVCHNAIGLRPEDAQARRCASATIRTMVISIARSSECSSNAITFPARRCRRSAFATGWPHIRRKLRKCAPPTAPMCSSVSPGSRTRANRSAHRGCR